MRCEDEAVDWVEGDSRVYAVDEIYRRAALQRRQAYG